MSKVIYSTDENALEQLKARLEKQKADYEEMKNKNKYFRKNCTMKGYPGIKDEDAARIDEAISKAYSWCKAPYPQYSMQNMSQRIRATEQRIKALEREESRTEEVYNTEGLGFDVVEDKDIARLQIIFPGDGRVDDKTYADLRHKGFVYSRTNRAFQRQLNEHARWAAQNFIKERRAMLNANEQTAEKTEMEM